MPFAFAAGVLRRPCRFRYRRGVFHSLKINRLFYGGDERHTLFGVGWIGSVRLQDDEGIGCVLLAQGVGLVGGSQQG